MSTESRQINKSAIRNFAIEARNILIKSAVTEAGFYGITKNEIKPPVQKGRDFEVYETLTGAEKRIFDSDIKRRAALVEAIRQKGFDEVMEETAYTWFNRLIAIRFMEVNNYLPFRMRVLSSDSGSLTPDIVSRSLEVGINLKDSELAAIQKAKDENSYDEAFRLLFIKACNELNDILPGLFEKTDDYMELLLKLPYTSDGVVRMLVDTIPESNFNVNEGGQVEIIGWLYQYYNEEKKNKVINIYKGSIKKEDVPAATQLFTTDWVVKYIVENSLGKYWIEHTNASELGENLPFLIRPRVSENEKEGIHVNPEEITFFDPAMGSGHFLIYAFELFMQIYREDGYSDRDAARSIIENNLFGLDIDDRAYQLSYFSVLMKARQYDRMFLKKHIHPRVHSIQDSNSINRAHLKYFGAGMNEIERNNAVNQLTGLLDVFIDAKEYGSILKVEKYDWMLLERFIEGICIDGQISFDSYGIENTQKSIFQIIDVAKILTKKYTIVDTNPPYMNRMDDKLKAYVQNEYKEYSGDVYSVFMYHDLELCEENGYSGMMTPFTWMFIKTYEKLRDYIIRNKTISSLIQMEYSAFEEATVPICTFVIKNCYEDQKGIYIKLSDFKGGMAVQKDRVIEAIANSDCDYWYENSASGYSRIPGKPIAYWVSENAASNYDRFGLIGDYAVTKQGFKTGNNDLFLKLWFEVCYNKTSMFSNRAKWFPCNKGGDFRKWYGNLSYVVDWENDGYKICNYRDDKGKLLSRPQNLQYNFNEGLTWTSISSGPISFRYSSKDMMFESKGSGCFVKDKVNLYCLLGFLNSCVGMYYIGAIAPTLDYSEGSILKLPYVHYESEEIVKLVRSNIEIAKEDWNSYETAWGFKKHPLLPNDNIGEQIYISRLFADWVKHCQLRIEQLKENEERLNSIYISLYKLEERTKSEVEYEYISYKSADRNNSIKSLISFAAGCMFGRYSLDVEGLAYAGGNWKEAYATKYKTFMPDEDAIIPITDEEYFKDDIVARFVDFIRIVYGEETLEENLKFIADALGNKGDTSRAVIRNYFLNDFYKDHCNTYSVTGSGKRPIYWLFDSGKQNGFKALIYIHRYTPDTVGLIRSVYLHNAQAAIQNSLQNSEYIISTTTSATERARETRKRDKYVKQLNELRPYYQALSHIALQRIPMDLDDGVKKNYQLFQNVEISTEGKKKQTIDLLAKL